MLACQVAAGFLSALSMAIGSSCTGPSAGAARQQQREIWGFTAFWDSLSTRSAARNGGALDALVTTWITLDSSGRSPAVLFRDSIASGRIPDRRIALITSYIHPSFRPAAIRRLAANPRGLSRAASSIAQTMELAGNRGAVLDFEALEKGDLPALAAVVRTVSDTLRTRGLGPVAVAVPASDTIAYPGRALVQAGADLILPMLYDQHWAGGPPGPVSARQWVETNLRMRISEVGAPRVVAGLPLYGYRWSSPGKAVTVTFAEAATAALTRDSTTGSLRASLAHGGEVWVTDAQLLGELMSIAEDQGVTRFALWYIGQEDPAVWRTVLVRPGKIRDEK